MKIVVANSHVAGVHGGAEELAANLVTHLNAQPGIEATWLRFPFGWQRRDRLATQILALRNIDLGPVDLFIPLKFPMYFIQAPRRHAWIVHQFRQSYDMHDGPFSYFDTGQVSLDMRAALIEQDNIELRSYDRLFTNSSVTQDRLFHYNRIKSDILHPPVNQPDCFAPEDYGDYFFAGGRITPIKRQKLILEALAMSRLPIRLVIAGPSEDPKYLAEIQAFIAQRGLGDRVTLISDFLPREKIFRLNNGCLAAVYLPVDEDSFGYVSMEAAQAAKALITTDDSGGVAQLVEHEISGQVVAPTAEALKDALETLWSDRRATKRMGRNAHDRLSALGLTWKSTLEVLLS